MGDLSLSALSVCGAWFHSQIQSHLDHHQVCSALYLAERWVAHVKHRLQFEPVQHGQSQNTLKDQIHPIIPASLAVAQCHVRMKKYKRAVHTLRRTVESYAEAANCEQIRYELAHAYYHCEQFDLAERTICAGNDGGLSKNESSFWKANENRTLNAYGWHLLGKIMTHTGRTEMAIKCHQKALEMNDALWDSFTELCRLGARPSHELVFHVDPKVMLETSNITSRHSTAKKVRGVSSALPFASSSLLSTHTTHERPAVPDAPEPGAPSPVRLSTKNSRSAFLKIPTTNVTPRSHQRSQSMAHIADFGSPRIHSPTLSRRTAAPSAVTLQESEHERTAKKLVHRNRRPSTTNSESLSKSPRLENPAQRTPRRSVRFNKEVSNNVSIDSACVLNTNTNTPLSQNAASVSVPSTARTPSHRRNYTQMAPVRKKGTSVMNDFSSTDTPLARLDLDTPMASPITDVANDASELGDDSMVDDVRIAPTDDTSFDEGHARMLSEVHMLSDELTAILQILANAYCCVAHFQCHDALRLLEHTLQVELSSACHFQTGFVAYLVGRCYFELARYPRAIEIFEHLRAIEPDRMSGLEFYSTALWHLRREVDLSYIAQQAVEFDKQSPETWIVVGNCFSLQKDHEHALRFFRRAIQLDKECVYAHTLSAHEHLANEDYEKALTNFRTAISIDSRHYNAWYGLGSVYYRQEKWDLAAYHFRQAIAIHPSSSVLYCNLGMALLASKLHEPALYALDRAEQLEVNNPLVKYQRATIYIAQERFEKAAHELEELRQLAPREASVHFLLGKVYKRMHQYGKALIRFTSALDLDPKDKHFVQSAIEKLHVNADAELDSSSEVDL